MTSTEKMWTEDVRMEYPKQWVVMTDLEDVLGKHGGYRVIGFVHLVTPDEDEARKTLRSLRATDDTARTVLVEGFNDSPQIGGLEIWSQ